MASALNFAFVVALFVALWATAVGSGLSHPPSAILTAAANRRRFAALIAVDVIAMPLVIFGIARLLGVPEGYTVGLILVGAASAGAISLAIVRLAGGAVPLAVGLVVVLEAGNIVTIPAWSAILLPQGVRPPLGDVVGTLVLGVLVPLVVGNTLRALRPHRAGGWAAALGRLSMAGLAVTVALLVAIDFTVLVAAWASLVPVVAAAATVCALGAGWAVAGTQRHVRATGAIVLAVRANTPALAVASATYGASSEASAAIVAFALITYVMSAAYAVWVRRSAS